MAFCSKCGAQFEGQFCTACGAPAGGGAAPAAGGSGLTTNMASTLCYALWIIGGIIFLLVAPYNTNKTVRFHAFQSIFLYLALTLVSIVVGIVLPIALYAIIYPLFWLACLALWIFLLLKTYQGSKVVLPLVGPLAEQQA